MLGTYASFLLVLGVSALVGQAIHALAGRRSWSPLSPAVGLAALLALGWATVRLPGEGLAALIALAVISVAAAVFLRGRAPGLADSLRDHAPVALAAAFAASLPFIAEMRFGILGTGLNPDMSQHLFAVDRLVSGGSERLIDNGYPLGPHALVTALAELGPSTVHAFDGLMIAGAVATCLAALGALEELSAWQRVAGALLVGFAYLLAANYVQGAFKEALEALFVVAFAIGLGQLAKGGPGSPRAPPLRALPLAVLAIGSVYAYSFPGLAWLAGMAILWGAVELARAARGGGMDEAIRLARLAAPAALVAVGVLVVAIAPEIGRIVRFGDFETFDPDGEGLGNLFNRLSPLEAFGIWPSGDFRVEPGDGAVPAIAFYLGAAFGAAVFVYALWRSTVRAARPLAAAVAAAAILWLYALLAGTPYQEAKALVILAPLVMLISIRGLLPRAPLPIALAFVLAAGGSGALALVNGPVGPSGYSPQLAELRDDLGEGSVFVEAPAELLDEQHGRDYLVWELRGNRICVGAEGDEPPQGPASRLVVTVDDDGAVVPVGTYLSRSAGVPGDETCPLIEDAARADPAGDD